MQFNVFGKQVVQKGHPLAYAIFLLLIVFGSLTTFQSNNAFGNPSLQLETVDLASVDGSWQTVNLINGYTSPVVVCSLNLVNNAVPAVIRITNVSAISFEIRLQNPGDGTNLVGDPVSCLIVEEGSWTLPDGTLLETQRISSTQVSDDGAWIPENINYNQPFTDPVVLGQVMSHNDPAWSTFWVRGATLSDPADANHLNPGLHVGEDPNISRTSETIGIVVLESGIGTLNGTVFQAFVGPKSVEGVHTNPPRTVFYQAAMQSTPAGAIVSQAGMAGVNGGWAVTYGPNPLGTTSINLAIDEDQVADNERYHIAENVSIFVYESPLHLGSGSPPAASPTPPPNPVPLIRLETVNVPAIGGTWQTISLTNSYLSPVVVCSMTLVSNSEPAVVRLNNVASSSFDIKLQNPGDQAPPSADPVTCLIAEEGVWTLPDGTLMEAVIYSSSPVYHDTNWAGESRAYGQPYSDPVVLGQVMSFNDPNWSAFWSRGSGANTKPDATALRVGRHVAEDPDTSRAAETIGYVVFESTSGTINGIPFQTFVGTQTVTGVEPNPPSSYSFPTPFATAPAGAIISQAGMAGANGGWALTYGTNPATNTTLDLVIDEDKLKDPERYHIGEHVAVLAFEQPLLLAPTADYATNRFQTLEITYTNPTWSGNEFDLIASATFTHTQTGITRTTEMFFAGNDTWAVRFGADLAGEWVYASSSADPELNGDSGIILVNQSTLPGFVTSSADSWIWSGNQQAFIPQFVMAAEPNYFYNNPTKIQADVANFIGDHGFTGLHVRVNCRWFDLNEPVCTNIPGNPNPDLQTFEALEQLISETYAAGGTVHLWLWRDEQRGQTPQQWGYNGVVDQRLQRYIAARLGPLPGWTLGYGFDLWEWTTESQLDTWHTTMHDHLGWPHLLMARAHKNQLTQISELMDVSSYEQHKPDYPKYVETLDERPFKPSFSADRFRVRPGTNPKDYSLDETRQGLWRSGMAGGVANIWGYLLNGGSDEGGSASYPNKDQIKLNSDFMAAYFSDGMVRCNSLTADGVCLRHPTSDHYIFYIENSPSIQLDLSGMAAAEPYIAIDTIAGTQITGTLPAITQTLPLTLSDWAIAVGDFCTIDPSNPHLGCN